MILFVFSVFEQITGLAVENLAKLCKGRKFYRLCSAVFENRYIRYRNADLLWKLRYAHFALCEHNVNVDYNVIFHCATSYCEFGLFSEVGGFFYVIRISVGIPYKIKRHCVPESAVRGEEYIAVLSGNARKCASGAHLGLIISIWTTEGMRYLNATI